MKTYPDSKPIVSIRHPWFIGGVDVLDGGELEEILDAVRDAIYKGYGVEWNTEESCYEGDNFDAVRGAVEKVMELVVALHGQKG